MKNKLILITGGSASGKTYVSNEITKILGNDASIISEDRFYKDGNKNTNYDIPSSFDFKEEKKALLKLLNDETTELPVYEFATHSRNGTEMHKPSKYLILEGIFTLHNKEIIELADFSIFVDTPSDMRLARRVKRDITERGREVNSILERWINDVQPAYLKYISPLKRDADIIIPWRKINNRSVKSLVAAIKSLD